MNKMTIFLAEDNELDKLAVEREFQKHGKIHTLHSFKNGKDLIDELESGATPNCILLDMDMPDVDGFSVLEYLKEKDKGEIPVIVMVSSVLHQELLEKIGCQPTAFLAKPVMCSEIFKTLES